MVQVTDVHVIEDCFDDSITRELVLDAPLDEGLMRAMAAGADLQYHPEFPRPYFRIHRPEDIVIQGVLGRLTCRVVLPRHGTEQAQAKLITLIEKGEE